MTSAAARVLGALTAAYSVAIMVRPKFLAKPCGLTTATGDVEPGMRTVIAGIGARDTAIGVAMMVAPPGTPLRVALAARVAADVGDAVVFGLTLPDRGARAKVAGFAAGWALLCGLSALSA
jgi:hypothetical protein